MQPDKLNYDRDVGILYKVTPFGNVDITDYRILFFASQIKNEIKDYDPDDLIYRMTQSRVIDPQFYMEKYAENREYLHETFRGLVPRGQKMPIANLEERLNLFANKSIKQAREKNQREYEQNPLVQEYYKLKGMQQEERFEEKAQEQKIYVPPMVSTRASMWKKI